MHKASQAKPPCVVQQMHTPAKYALPSTAQSRTCTQEPSNMVRRIYILLMANHDPMCSPSLPLPNPNLALMSGPASDHPPGTKPPACKTQERPGLWLHTCHAYAWLGAHSPSCMHPVDARYMMTASLQSIQQHCYTTPLSPLHFIRCIAQEPKAPLAPSKPQSHVLLHLIMSSTQARCCHLLRPGTSSPHSTPM